MIRDVMRVQGVLNALVSSLKEAAVTVQLDLLSTISMLLYKNRKNQIEFKRLGGFAIVMGLLDRVCAETWPNELLSQPAEPKTSSLPNAPVARADAFLKVTREVICRHLAG